MSTWIVRVWLPDRPGALGQVASRIGAVRGDVVGIDILERGAGRAIDELAVGQTFVVLSPGNLPPPFILTNPIPFDPMVQTRAQVTVVTVIPRTNLFRFR